MPTRQVNRKETRLREAGSASVIITVRNSQKCFSTVPIVVISLHILQYTRISDVIV